MVTILTRLHYLDNSNNSSVLTCEAFWPLGYSADATKLRHRHRHKITGQRYHSIDTNADL